MQKGEPAWLQGAAVPPSTLKLCGKSEAGSVGPIDSASQNHLPIHPFPMEVNQLFSDFVTFWFSEGPQLVSFLRDGIGLVTQQADIHSHSSSLALSLRSSTIQFQLSL